MSRDYFGAMDKVRPTEDWKARTLAALDKAGETCLPRRRAAVRALAAAAVFGVLFATAVAVSPGLREALSDALGSFAPYSAEPEGVSATDQGIEVRAVSALSDGNVVQYYLSVRDKTGDRLGERTVIDGIRMDRPDADYAAGGYSSGYLVNYDPETRTALYELRFTGDGPPAKGGTLEVEIRDFQPDRWRESGTLDQGLLTDRTLKTEVLETGETVLTPEQTPAEVEGTDTTVLSSLGFGTDGLLHVQLRLRDDLDREKSRQYANVGSRSTVPEQHDRLDRYYFDYQKSNAVDFERDGHWYTDSVFNVWPCDLDDVLLAEVQVIAVKGEAIEGSWKLSIPLEDVPHRQIALEEKIGLVTVKSLDLTTLGLSTESDPEGGAGTLSYPAAVILDDGTAVTAGTPDSLFHTNGRTYNHWSFDAPIDPEQAAGVAFGCWYIPIGGETAGPGYWLEKPPEE